MKDVRVILNREKKTFGNDKKVGKKEICRSKRPFVWLTTAATTATATTSTTTSPTSTT